MSPPPRYVRYVLQQAPTPVTWVIVALNTAVYALWWAAWLFGGRLEAWVTRNFLVSLDGVLDGAVWTLLTSAFSQLNLLHFALNMMVLVMFGRDVERVVGPSGFVHLYVMGGIVASIGHVLYSLVTFDPTPALGASGAVMAILVVSTFLFPMRLVVFFFIPMPQSVFLVLYLLSDLFGLFGGGGGIAHAAHLGGALYGWLYVRRHMATYLEGRLRSLGVVRRIRRT